MKVAAIIASVLLTALISAMAAAQVIPPGTALPVMLSSTLDSRNARPGQQIKGTLMQNVPLADSATLPRGAKVVGHIVSADAGPPSRLAIQFDEVQFRGKRLPLTAQLRALASMNEVFEARMPTNAWDDFGTSPSDWNTVQIGGAGVYRGNGEVVDGDRVVGRATDSGAVTAKLIAAPRQGCAGDSQSDQALWKFSPWACGTYGFDDLRIVRSESGNRSGEIVLEGSHVRVDAGSGWLLVASPAR